MGGARWLGSRGYDGGNVFWVTWGLIAGGLFIGFLCAQEGDAHRITMGPGDATPEQVEASAAEMEEFMREAGFTDEQIERVLERHRCKYLEDCDEAGSR